MRASFALLAPLALATLLLPTAPATTAEPPTTGTAIARYTGHDVALLTASFVAVPDPLNPNGVFVEAVCTAETLEPGAVVLCDAGSASTTGTSAGLVSVAVGTFYLTGSPSDVRVCASIVGAPFPPACANPVI